MLWRQGSLRLVMSSAVRGTTCQQLLTNQHVVSCSGPLEQLQLLATGCSTCWAGQGPTGVAVLLVAPVRDKGSPTAVDIYTSPCPMPSHLHGNHAGPPEEEGRHQQRRGHCTCSQRGQPAEPCRLLLWGKVRCCCCRRLRGGVGWGCSCAAAAAAAVGGVGCCVWWLAGAVFEVALHIALHIHARGYALHVGALLRVAAGGWSACGGGFGLCCRTGAAACWWAVVALADPAATDCRHGRCRPPAGRCTPLHHGLCLRLRAWLAGHRRGAGVGTTASCWMLSPRCNAQVA